LFYNKELNEGMMKLTWINNFYQDDFGASAVEYGILLAWIAVIIMSAVTLFGGSVKGLYVQGGGIF
jgi:pilus assembly protein Flp/PilA